MEYLNLTSYIYIFYLCLYISFLPHVLERDQKNGVMVAHQTLLWQTLPLLSLHPEAPAGSLCPRCSVGRKWLAAGLEAAMFLRSEPRSDCGNATGPGPLALGITVEMRLMKYIVVKAVLSIGTVALNKHTKALLCPYPLP